MFETLQLVEAVPDEIHLKNVASLVITVLYLEFDFRDRDEFQKESSYLKQLLHSVQRVENLELGAAAQSGEDRSHPKSSIGLTRRKESDGRSRPGLSDNRNRSHDGYRIRLVVAARGALRPSEQRRREPVSPDRS
ncbi:hypothetical protein HAX54_019602, partial [Datura stramonium]|nr:hypothetical protein [Datura stramonium]